jgi:hypothetical protein
MNLPLTECNQWLNTLFGESFQRICQTLCGKNFQPIVFMLNAKYKKKKKIENTREEYFGKKK